MLKLDLLRRPKVVNMTRVDRAVLVVLVNLACQRFDKEDQQAFSNLTIKFTSARGISNNFSGQVKTSRGIIDAALDQVAMGKKTLASRPLTSLLFDSCIVRIGPGIGYKFTESAKTLAPMFYNCLLHELKHCVDKLNNLPYANYHLPHDERPQEIRANKFADDALKSLTHMEYDAILDLASSLDDAGYIKASWKMVNIKCASVAIGDKWVGKADVTITKKGGETDDN